MKKFIKKLKDEVNDYVENVRYHHRYMEDLGQMHFLRDTAKTEIMKFLEHIESKL